MFDFIGELTFQAIFYPIGWPVVKLLTLGKYPSRRSWFSETPESQWTAGAGLAVVVIGVMLALGQFGR
ncbi:hypothetical protein [Pseudomonas sp. R5(2019)]|uniref:hypothetical protein n=1 Tax=Pseudomonas sp. R5(2019) TaxID=2697566 RepID=UPI0014131D6A|nr:hypothetical protein [Pseudomonas sp. R5(2019)]NBA97171.1 hypothetical protein [Pseudomonas sp. R5(2019)]